MSTGFKQLKHDMANGPLDRSPFPFSPVPPTTPAGSAQEHRFLDACSHFGCDNRKKMIQVINIQKVLLWIRDPCLNFQVPEYNVQLTQRRQHMVSHQSQQLICRDPDSSQFTTQYYRSWLKKRFLQTTLLLHKLCISFPKLQALPNSSTVWFESVTACNSRQFFRCLSISCSNLYL